ncbi:MAG: YtxH domain-containing protein, partial [Candidatus Kapaibacterium sp.]
MDRYCRNQSSMGPFALGALIGGVVGAAVALLYAPSEGSELRESIGEKVDDLSDDVTKVFSKAKRSAEHLVNEGRDQG